MATDKKSDHVGNHGGRYTDMDGMTKQFTVIDHDKKVVPIYSGSPDPNYDPKKYRADVIKKISEISASICPEQFIDYTLRGENKDRVEWNLDMLLDNGIPINQLRDLLTILENRLEIGSRLTY